MALELVTMDQARAQLRMDADVGAEDLWLQDAIQDVSDAVAAWLKDSWRLYVIARTEDGSPVLDSNDDPVAEVDDNDLPLVRPAVRRAVLLEVASQYRFREGEGDNVVPADAGHGYVLSKGATAMLQPLRRSTVR